MREAFSDWTEIHGKSCRVYSFAFPGAKH